MDLPDLLNNLRLSKRKEKREEVPYGSSTAIEYLRESLRIMEAEEGKKVTLANNLISCKSFPARIEMDEYEGAFARITFGTKLIERFEEDLYEGMELTLSREDKIYEGIIYEFDRQSILARAAPAKKDQRKMVENLLELKPETYHVQFIYSNAIIVKKMEILSRVPPSLLFPEMPSNSPLIPRIDRKWHSHHLNRVQKEAIEGALGSSSIATVAPFLIRGPPGTGKTTALIELLLQILDEKPEARICICTPSNKAADNVLERIPPEKVKSVLRWLSSSQLAKLSFNKMIREFTYSDKYEEHSVVVKTIGKLHGFFQYDKLQLQREEDLPTHFIIDEASQVPDTDMFLVLSLLGSASHFVMFGDDRQLGPVVTEEALKNGPLTVSMFERLLKKPNFEASSVCLLENYRSVPGIVATFNRLFYGDTLLAMVTETRNPKMFALKKKIHKLMLPKEGDSLDPSGVFFVAVKGPCASGETKSWANPKEAQRVAEIFGELLRIGVKRQEIGIITPYRGQMNLLRREIKEKVDIGTVDSFQGQEREVIIMSTVRSFGAKGIGFVGNDKRLNVSISRAKTSLIIVGNDEFLASASRRFKMLIQMEEVVLIK